MARAVLGIVAGLIIGVIFALIVGSVGPILFPTPEAEGADVGALKSLFADMPPGALVFFFVALGLGSFVGASAATLIVRRSPYPGIIVGAVILAAGLYAMALTNHPVWIVAIAIAATIGPAMFAALTFARR